MPSGLTTRMQPLTQKYRPKNLSEVQGHDKAAQQALAYVRDYKRQRKKGMLLHGPPGVGKTSLAYAVAGELGLEVVEVNASDVRNADAIKTIVGAAMQQQSLFSTGKIILFDEVDGLSGTKDRGGIAALTDLMKTSAHPVLLTANDPWDKKFATLRKYVELVELGSLPYPSVNAVLRRVAEAEGIAYEEQALKTLARRAGGDLRGALTDLQTAGQDKLIDAADLDNLGERRKAETMHTALQRILKGRDPALARQAVDSVDENLDDVFLWVEENIPREYTKAEDLACAFDHLSRADVHRGRIRRWQHWRFLVYVIDEMCAGVALAKKERYPGFVKYQRTQRLLKIWRANQANAKRNAIAKKVADKTHTSTKVARESTLPYLARMLKSDSRHGLVDAFDLASEEVEWLAKQA